MNCNFLKLTAKDIKTIQGFMALFDILGYSQWIKQNSIENVVIDHKNMKRMATTNVEHFLNYALKEDIIKVLSYADTFLIYTNQISETAFKAIMAACRGMFEAAICFGLPIRGAVTCGEFYASEDMITGKPLIAAFEKEKEQDWIGCWIMDMCFEKISNKEKRRYLDDKTVVRYPIPIKAGKVKKVYAYNWVNHAIQNPRDIDLNYLTKKSFLRKAKSHSWHEERKIKNTIEFYKLLKIRKDRKQARKVVQSKIRPMIPTNGLRGTGR